jgi:hypothetical protein
MYVTIGMGHAVGSAVLFQRGTRVPSGAGVESLMALRIESELADRVDPSGIAILTVGNP